MDRLICGDVGFGKTEVALRAAFIAAMNGKQVAVVVPTTLLARQHFKTFSERFRGFPVKIGAGIAARVIGRTWRRSKKGLAEGDIDIVIGTHALLGKAISFKDLGLLIVDEEQHFGVAHKEKLKALRAEVHVLTLTATPIPRTLQLALTGVRDLSIIASPPVDRLAVRTFVSPFDPLVVREALLRERYRGGQSFYVCPAHRGPRRREGISSTRPCRRCRVAVAHGQMPATTLEDIMSAFYDGKYDVLLSTTIIESGLDIPTANTLIVHRADRFGLAQLYQLRGRVGRAKIRAYALFTLPAGTPDHRAGRAAAEGAAIARHAGRRLPARLARPRHSRRRQSAGRGAIRPHQGSRLRALPADAGRGGRQPEGRHRRAGRRQMVAADHDRHAGAHSGRLCRRPAGAARRFIAGSRTIEDEREIDAFGAELVDRFGPLPEEVKHLLQIVAIKSLCRRANVEKIDTGPKGAVLSFRDNTFANPEGLIGYIRDQAPVAKVRPDMKVVFLEDWEQPEERLTGTTAILRNLVASPSRRRRRERCVSLGARQPRARTLRRRPTIPDRRRSADQFKALEPA